MQADNPPTIGENGFEFIYENYLTDILGEELPNINESQEKTGYTPLILSIMNSSFEFAKFLIKKELICHYM